MFKYKYTLLLSLSIIAYISLHSFAQAHSWYPLVCCGGQDCHPVPCQELIETAHNYIYHGIKFAKEQIQPSLDSFCHVCISNEHGENGMTPVPHCAFIQLGE